MEVSNFCVSIKCIVINKREFTSLIFFFPMRIFFPQKWKNIFQFISTLLKYFFRNEFSRAKFLTTEQNEGYSLYASLLSINNVFCVEQKYALIHIECLDQLINTHNELN